jgi:dipeptidyl aminopeptidase/acylaminoacyl peptidase
VTHEVLVLPDEIHGFLRHRSWVTADSATVAWFGKRLGEP